MNQDPINDSLNHANAKGEAALALVSATSANPILMRLGLITAPRTGRLSLSPVPILLRAYAVLPGETPRPQPEPDPGPGDPAPVEPDPDVEPRPDRIVGDPPPPVLPDHPEPEPLPDVQPA